MINTIYDYEKDFKLDGIKYCMIINPVDHIYRRVWLPIKVKAEYPTYFVVEVLQHQNPNGYGISKPYNMTIHKNDLIRKRVKIK